MNTEMKWRRLFRGTQATSLGLLLRLFKRRVDSPELGAQIATDAVDCTDDRERDTGCDKAVFNGGRTRFVIQETHKKFGHSKPPVRAKVRPCQPKIATK